MSACNYCTLKGIKSRAIRNGMKVTVLRQNVYVHPFNVRILHTSPAKKREQYFVAWFMELTEHCVC